MGAVIGVLSPPATHHDRLLVHGSSIVMVNGQLCNWQVRWHVQAQMIALLGTLVKPMRARLSIYVATHAMR